jgi:O-succinylbenzoate synthase
MRGGSVTYRFEHRVYRLPLRVPLRTAHGPWAEREGIVVRLEDDAGVVGFGEIAPIPWFGTESLAEAVEICRRFGDRVSTETLDAVSVRLGAVRFALAAARMRQAEPVGPARVPLTALLPAGRAVLAALPARLEAGWLTFKWKVGVGAAEEELAILDDLLAALPSYAKLRLDANGAWDRRQAERWLVRCADRPIEFVEQPVDPKDENTLHGLAEDYPVKLALDESVAQLDEARRWQAEGWPGIFVIKPALAGPLEDIAAWVMASQADVVLSSAIETALGRAAILQFALRHRAVLLRRAAGFGIGEVFGDRRWDGPMLGAQLDEGWAKGVNPEELWNALG